MEYNPLEAGSFLPSQILRLLYQKVHCRAHDSHLLVNIPNLLNPVHSESLW
jgi:hypothetical protein